MKLSKILNAIEKTAPLVLQESYDNSGLLVGLRDAEIKGALLSLDCTEAVVEEAIRTGCDLVISHHPVIFKGLRNLTDSTPEQRTIRLAIKKNIALYACHTNLDNVIHGVNGKIASKLGLEDLHVLRPLSGILTKLVTFCPLKHADTVRKALFDAGAGSIGNYDQCSFNLEGFGTFRGNSNTAPFVGEKNKQHREKESRIETVFPSFLRQQVLNALFGAHPYQEVAYDLYSMDNPWQQAGAGLVGTLKGNWTETAFLALLKVVFGLKSFRHTALLGKKIKKVAVCGGSGSFLIPDALKAGANIFLSADVKYHDFFQADGKMIVADIGHFESEQFTPEIFYEVLKRNFPKFAVRFSKVKTNPINYF